MDGAPRTVTTDQRSEQAWLVVLNRAFAQHVSTDCGIKWACGDRSCPESRVQKGFKDAVIHQAVHRAIRAPVEPVRKLHRDVRQARYMMERLGDIALRAPATGTPVITSTAEAMAPLITAAQSAIDSAAFLMLSAADALGTAAQGALAAAANGDDEDDDE